MSAPIACLPPQNAGRWGPCLSQSPLCVHCLRLRACTWSALILLKGTALKSYIQILSLPLHPSHAACSLIFSHHSSVIPPDALGSLAWSMSASGLYISQPLWFGSLVPHFFLLWFPHTQPLILPLVTHKNGSHQKKSPYFSALNPTNLSVFPFRFATITTWLSIKCSHLRGLGCAGECLTPGSLGN